MLLNVTVTFVNRYKNIYFPHKSFLDGSASIEVESFLKADQTLEDFGKVETEGGSSITKMGIAKGKMCVCVRFIIIRLMHDLYTLGATKRLE